MYLTYYYILLLLYHLPVGKWKPLLINQPEKDTGNPFGHVSQVTSIVFKKAKERDHHTLW